MRESLSPGVKRPLTYWASGRAAVLVTAYGDPGAAVALGNGTRLVEAGVVLLHGLRQATGRLVSIDLAASLAPQPRDPPHRKHRHRGWRHEPEQDLHAHEGMEPVSLDEEGALATVSKLASNTAAVMVLVSRRDFVPPQPATRDASDAG
jgi:hypothetical protein